MYKKEAVLPQLHRGILIKAFLKTAVPERGSGDQGGCVFGLLNALQV